MTADSLSARRVTIAGLVQGIGYRPALARLATDLRLTGWVRNTLIGIEAHVQGNSSDVASFLNMCQAACPNSGRVDRLNVNECQPQSYAEFRIVQQFSTGPVQTTVPVDLVTCQECSREAQQVNDRRYAYGLISCNQCGPRYSILEAMPYERQLTSMIEFPLCDACRNEYECPFDRRYHAQTTCCQRCGPTLTNLDQAIRALRDGQVVGIKGIGGYQLLVDAGQHQSVVALRRCKGRESKPLVIMVADIRQAEQLALLSEQQRAVLQSPAGPVVVLERKHNLLPAAISPGLSSIGMMLPTTEVHAWLVDQIGPLVVTSGNLEGEPIAYRADSQFTKLQNITSIIIDHPRRIVRPTDDSVVRVMAGREATLRLSRGLAPLPLPGISRPQTDHHLLALGGHQKTAIALYNGQQAVLGPHVGDMDSVETRRRLVEHIQDFTALYSAEPTVLVHDLHPDYFTTVWAKQSAQDMGLRTLAVQHHHAHVVSGMLEAHVLDRTVLGLAWDGSGLGSDGTIWGGEAMIASKTSFRRVASVRPFALLGGQSAIRHPWRVAFALLQQVRLWNTSFAFQYQTELTLAKNLERLPQTVWTTSIGRLFDAVAALILSQAELGDGHASYEGHFAAMLESACNRDATGIYPMPLVSSLDAGRQIDELDWRPMIAAMIADKQKKIPASTMAMRFTRTLADAVVRICSKFPTEDVVLSGGVFQNQVLVELIAEQFSSSRVNLVLPGRIPVNDGGLAAGQLAIAISILEQEQCA
jgi:hydrogenase maturation protein HypF